ncbi:MAG: DUF4328 domain-containing protein [Bacillota bacterium]
MAKLTLFEMLKRWIKIPLFIYVGALVIECLAAVLAIFFLSGAAPDENAQRGAGLSLVLMGGMALIELVMNLAVAVLFLRLLYKAVQKAQGFATPFTYVSPGWAVGYWFIPLMNLYRPFEVVKALFKACAEQAGGKPTAGEQLLGAWWAMFLLSNIVGFMVARMDTDMNSAAGITVYAEYTLGCNLLFIAAAALFWLVLQRLVMALDAPAASLAATQPA